jgi:hypothetical protein
MFIASLAVFVGVGYVGLLGAVLATTAFVLLSSVATRSRLVRRSLAWNNQRRARARRESKRRDALCRATAARREQYFELLGLVEGIERSDPVEAQRLELQELLGHFVQLAVGHQRCVESLRVAGASEAQLQLPFSEDSSSRRCLDITARRLRHREETRTRIEHIADEIDSADGLIRLVAQRTACAHLDALIDGQREIDRRLADLDEVEAALVQISG